MTRLCTPSAPALRRRSFAALLAAITVAVQAPGLHASPQEVTFMQSARRIERYDMVEITLQVKKPDAGNPGLWSWMSVQPGLVGV